MIVLLDLEWIERRNEKSLTQLSALRTDETWQEISHLDLLAKPDGSFLPDMSHVAYGGYKRSVYEEAMSEQDCVAAFHDWLCPEDTLWVWADSNRRYLDGLLKRYPSDRAMPACFPISDAVCSMAFQGRKPAIKSPYRLLQWLGQEPLLPEHRASNDVEVVREILEALHMPRNNPLEIKKDAVPPQKQTPPKPKPSPKPPISQRERNQQVITKSDYNYIFLLGSKVFHRRDCKVCLRAKDHGNIKGSVYYDASSEGRRPCKICQPIAGLSLSPMSLKKCAKKWNDEIIRTTLLTGKEVRIKRRDIIGWCKCYQHPGSITKALLEEHNCLGKQCFHLQRNLQCPFWIQREAERKAQEARKAKLKKERELRESEEFTLQMLADDWQDYLDEIDSDMYIVRVAKDTPFQYRIFYVSDNPFADGNCYPELLGAIHSRYPKIRIVLRHIRDLDGHFVTTDEYFARRKMLKRA